MHLPLRLSTIRTWRMWLCRSYLSSVELICISAYEIKYVHDQVPPPKEILEDISAKGGDILKRTVDNFRPPQVKEQVNGQDSEESGEEGRGTPKQDKMEIDEPGSGSGRTTRGRLLSLQHTLNLLSE